MSERDLLRFIVNMNATGYMMLKMADDVEPLLEKAGICREDWERAANWLQAVCDQLGAFFSPDVIQAELADRVADFIKIVAQRSEIINDRPDWNKIMEDWKRE